MPRGLQRIEDEKARERAKALLRAYMQCIRDTVARLDVGRSGADIVARGLQSACRAKFNEAVNLSPDFKTADARETLTKALEPDVVQTVLEYRAKKQKTK